MYLIIYISYHFCSAATVSMLWNSLGGVFSDDFFLIPTKEAKECLRVAQEMLQHVSKTNRSHEQFCV